MRRHPPFLAILCGLALGSSPALATNHCGDVENCIDDLRSVSDELDSGKGKQLGEAAANKAVSMKTGHDAAIEDRGYGLYYGNQLKDGSKWPGATPVDCTTYVLSVLKAAFEEAGMPELWTKLFREAIASSNGLFKGLELLKALEGAGWTGIYWNPDTKNPGDDDDEHPYTNYIVNKKGTYYGLPVDKERSVLNYDPTEVDEGERGTALDNSGFNALEKIPFGVLAARGGQHMAMVVNGEVYEVHWSTGAQSPAVITAVPLNEWGWMSGVIVVPPGY
jgi:hypothetical protein